MVLDVLCLAVGEGSVPARPWRPRPGGGSGASPCPPAMLPMGLCRGLGPVLGVSGALRQHRCWCCWVGRAGGSPGGTCPAPVPGLGTSARSSPAPGAPASGPELPGPAMELVPRRGAAPLPGALGGLPGVAERERGDPRASPAASAGNRELEPVPCREAAGRAPPRCSAGRDVSFCCRPGCPPAGRALRSAGGRSGAGGSAAPGGWVRVPLPGTPPASHPPVQANAPF